MTVDSYLELFTTLFGWTFYNILWDVLLGTGIVFLPFLGILIDNWREPAEGGEFGTVTGLSLRRMELEMFIALLVVVLANLGSAAIGTLLSALSNTLRRESSLFVLLALPAVIPVILGAARATTLLIDGQFNSEWWLWIQLLAGFSVIFVVAGSVLFEFVIEE